MAVLPTASSYPGEVYETYRRAFRDLGAEEVFCVDIRYRDEADLIFFTGGDQERLVEILQGSRIIKRVR